MPPAPRSLLAVTTTLGQGGAELALVRLLNSLDRTRWRSCVAVSIGGGSYAAQLDADVPVYDVGAGPCRGGNARTLLSWRRLRSLVAAIRPDMVLSYLTFPNCAAAIAIEGVVPRPAHVMNVQGPRYLRPGAGRAASWLARALMRRYYPRADAIVAVSSGLADELIRHVPALAGRVQVLPNVVVDGREAAAAGPPAGRPAGPLLVACGRLSREKGFDVLIAALAQVRRRIPAALWIVGEGPERPALEAQIREAGLEPAVRLWGWTDHPAALMAAADAVVVPSRYEGFGNVIVEAMALGVPVVATDCPGPREIVRSDAGLLVPPEDPAALAAAIVRLLEDPALRAGLAAAGRERARRYEARTVAAEYERLLDAVIAGRAP